MDKADAVTIVRDYLSTQFPKSCPCCNKHYAFLREYIENTTRVGQPISYDAEKDDWNPTDPLGTFSMRNCACATTMTLHSNDLELKTLWKLMDWAKSESEKRGIGMSDLLEDLRTAVVQSVLDDDDQTQ